MLDRLLGAKITIEATILGVVGDRMVHWRGQVRLRGATDVRRALQAMGRAAGVDLTHALDQGQGEPTLLLNGHRLTLPGDLTRPVEDGASLSWLMPMAGG